ncbi:MAG: PilC/PilY family type IV pilus protein [Nitrospirota bacterium]
MQLINTIKRFQLCLVMLVACMGSLFSFVSSSWAATEPGALYNAPIPFLVPDAKSNILLLLDNSGSMDACLYPGKKEQKCVGQKFLSDLETGNGFADTGMGYNGVTIDNYTTNKGEAPKEYKGYFDPKGCYRYSAEEMFVLAQNKVNGLCNANRTFWDGNFLNWLMTTRMDTLTIALTGGQCEQERKGDPNLCQDNVFIKKGSVSGNHLNRHVLFSDQTLLVPQKYDGHRCIRIHGGSMHIHPGIFNKDGSRSDISSTQKITSCYGLWFQTVFTTITSATTTVSTYSPNNFPPVTTTTSPTPEGTIISRKFTHLPYSAPGTAIFKLRIKRTGEEAKGVLQETQDLARFGLMFFNAYQGGHIERNIGSKMIDIINDIEKVEPNANTPLAESLFEAMRYYAQIPTTFKKYDAKGQDGNYSLKNNYEIGLDYDPYYQNISTDPNKEDKQWIKCCNSYVLLMTDGMPTQDTEVLPNVAGTTTSSSVPNIRSLHQNDPNDLTSDHYDICSSYYDLLDFYGTTTSINTREQNCSLRTAIGVSHSLDDVAYWGHITDLRPDDRGNIQYLDVPSATSTPIGKLTGIQNITLYSILAFNGYFGTSTATAGFRPNIVSDAAMFGGFKPSEADKSDPNYLLPDKKEEWDILDNVTREPKEGGDGIPDNYFEAKDLISVRGAFLSAIYEMSQKAGSATGLASMAASSGEGAVYRAYFLPRAERTAWVGYLQAFHLDDRGQMREDDGDGMLVIDRDHIIRTYYDIENKEAKAERCVPDAKGGIVQVIQGQTTVDNCLDIELDDIQSLWEAGKALAKRTASSRQIWTTINNTSVIEFTKSELSGRGPYLRAQNAGERDKIIDFIRGEKVDGFRKRERIVDGQADMTWKLGDIVNSQPVLVASPTGKYNKKYGDVSYSRFLRKYKKRRQVVYVGANDGMLHAFNGGFYHSGNNTSTKTVEEHGYFTKTMAGNEATGIPLGDELWAFIPQELLPHLKLITSTDYNQSKHYFFMDGSPRVVDARVFREDADHPWGWGTILIIGMRMGGGKYRIDRNNDGIVNQSDGDDLRSAYFAFDVTNPEWHVGNTAVAPKLLWVFNGEDDADHDLGFTTGFPAIMRVKSNSADTEKKGTWYVTFGSGPLSYKGERDMASPSNLFYNDSSEYGKLYVIDLLTGRFRAKLNMGGADRYAFMGDPTVLDLERTKGEPIDDVVYIGKTYGTKTTYDGNDFWNWKGKAHRILTNSEINPEGWTISTLIDPAKPVLMPVIASSDQKGRPWVFFGTGRLFSSGPQGSDNGDMSLGNRIYGIKEGGPNGCWNSSEGIWKKGCTTTIEIDQSLVNVTDIKVKKGGYLSATTTAFSTVFGFADRVINDPDNPQGGKSGWYIDLKAGERALVSPSILAGALFLPTYTPDNGNDVCSVFGNSTLYGLYYETGTAFANQINEKGLFNKESSDETVLRDNSSVLINKNLQGEARDSASNRGMGAGIASGVIFTIGKVDEIGRIVIEVKSQSSSGNITTGSIAVVVPRSGVKMFMDKVE